MWGKMICSLQIGLFLFFVFVQESQGIFWSNHRVTWMVNASAPGAFDKMPFTALDALAQGWVPISQDDCKNNGHFNGFRYVDGSDGQLSLLFDIAGYLVGVQMNLKKSDLAMTNNTYRFDRVPNYVANVVLGNPSYTLTGYFVHPDRICKEGRTLAEVWAYGLGKDLYFQNGPSPKHLIHVPKKRDVAVSEGWSASACVPGMGYHSYYRMDTFAATNCDYVRPYFLLYNSNHGELHGFGFIGIGHCSSPRFEHPGTSAVWLVLGPSVAQCMVDVPAKSQFCQMHNYFVEEPWNIKC